MAGMAIIPLLFMLLLVIGLGVVGILLVLGSKERGLPYPSCGKCGYDVSGSVGSVTRCPECGLSFTEAGIVPPGGRRQRVKFAIGIVLIVIATGCVGSTLLSPLLYRATAGSGPPAIAAPPPAPAPTVDQSPDADAAPESAAQPPD